MEIFILAIALLILITIILPWVNNSRIGSIKNDVRHLQDKLNTLESKLSNISDKSSDEITKSPWEEKVRENKKDKIKEYKDYYPSEDLKEDILTEENSNSKSYEAHKEEVVETYIKDTPKKSKPLEKKEASFELNIATKLPVWIGAISLICAAFFLVKYSIELGWLGPMVRVSLGTIFGFGLLASGKFIGSRQYIANSTRIGQGLIGAGLVTLYVSIYVAINLYGLISPFIGFIGMAIVTAMAVILSIRHGQPIAVFGLIGGLLTPVLIGSDAPSAFAMFGYLFLLFSGMFTILVRQGWWTLAISSVIGVFAWLAYWLSIAFIAEDAIILILFAMAITMVILVVTGKRISENAIKDSEKMPIHGLNFTAIIGGVITIIWLSFKINLTLFDWSIFGLFSVALIFLTYLKPKIYQTSLLVKFSASLILFYFWAQDVSLMNSIPVLIGMGVIYIISSGYIMRKANDPRFWAGIQVYSAISIYVVSYFSLSIQDYTYKYFDILWGMIGFTFAGLSVFQTFEIIREFQSDNKLRKHLLAIYTLSSSAFISIAFALILPFEFLPLAIVSQILATAWIYQKSGVEFLKNIIIILTILFASLNYEQIILFSNVIISSLFGSTPSSRWVGIYELENPLMKLGIPAIFILMSLWISIKTKKTSYKFNQILFSVSAILLMMTSYYILKDVFQTGLNSIFASQTSFIKRGVITIICAGSGIGLIQVYKRYGLDIFKSWGVGLFYLAMLRFAYFDFLIHNPYWSKTQFVGNLTIINGITLTYGIGGLLASWAVYSKEITSNKLLYKILAFASLFTFVSCSVRHFFHGGNLMANGGAISSAELYAYSIVWLLTGLCLLMAGIIMKSKEIRMSSLGFISLAIVKVFLFDASNLEGLYRVFSFLGLGISLIGLSFFYTKFISSNEVKKMNI